MKRILLTLILFLAINNVSADIRLEFSNLNISNYNLEVYAANKTLMNTFLFDEVINLSATSDYIIHINPVKPELLNISNFVSYTSSRLDRIETGFNLFVTLSFFMIIIAFFKYLTDT